MDKGFAILGGVLGEDLDEVRREPHDSGERAFLSEDGKYLWDRQAERRPLWPRLCCLTSNGRVQALAWRTFT